MNTLRIAAVGLIATLAPFPTGAQDGLMPPRAGQFVSAAEQVANGIKSYVQQNGERVVEKTTVVARPTDGRSVIHQPTVSDCVVLLGGCEVSEGEPPASSLRGSVIAGLFLAAGAYPANGLAYIGAERLGGTLKADPRAHRALADACLRRARDVGSEGDRRQLRRIARRLLRRARAIEREGWVRSE